MAGPILSRNYSNAAKSEVHRERISDEANATREELQDLHRESLKSKGYKVDAIDKKYEKTIKEQAKADLAAKGGGLDLDQHPLEVPSEGIIPDDVVLPESQIDKDKLSAAEKSKLENKLKKQLKLKQRMTNKIKFKQKPSAKPRFKARNSPSPRPGA